MMAKKRSDSLLISAVPVHLRFPQAAGKPPRANALRAEAEEKFLNYQETTSYDGALALFGGWTGIDLSEYAPDEKLEFIDNGAIQSVTEVFKKVDPNKHWTVEDVAKFISIGGLGPIAVGAPEKVADTMEQWVNEAGVDGFNIAHAVTPGTFREFVDEVVPVLQERGLVQQEYSGKTLRANITGQNHLPDHHPGKQYRLSLKPTLS